jgi:hypothetical protein
MRAVADSILIQSICSIQEILRLGEVSSLLLKWQIICLPFRLYAYYLTTVCAGRCLRLSDKTFGPKLSVDSCHETSPFSVTLLLGLVNETHSTLIVVDVPIAAAHSWKLLEMVLYECV